MAGVLDMAGLAAGATPVLAGASVLSNIYSGYKNAQAVKEQQGLVNDFEADIESAYNNSQRNFLETNAASGILTRSQQQLRDANKATENKGVITGATNENQIAAKTANQKGYADSLNRVASMGTAYQNQAEGRYMAAKPAILGQKMNLLNNKIEGAQNNAVNSGNLLDSVMDLAGFMM